MRRNCPDSANNLATEASISASSALLTSKTPLLGNLRPCCATSAAPLSPPPQFLLCPLLRFGLLRPLPPILPAPDLAAAAAATGHLALACAHPDLRGLDALLTPESFLLDATHALAAAALRYRPGLSGERIRLLRREDIAARMIAWFEESGGAEKVWHGRMFLALLQARDGHFEEALSALACLAAERPYDPRPRISTAGICYLVGLEDEGNRWISAIPKEVRQENGDRMQMAILAATMGGAPRAVAGLEGLVGFAALEVMDQALWAKFVDGEVSFLQWMMLRGLLRLSMATVAGKYKDDM